MKAPKKAYKSYTKRLPKEEMIVKSPPPPSIDDLIAEARELGEDDIANAFEKIRYLESPKGQKAIERRERRLSRL